MSQRVRNFQCAIFSVSGGGGVGDVSRGNIEQHTKNTGDKIEKSEMGWTCSAYE